MTATPSRGDAHQVSYSISNRHGILSFWRLEQREAERRPTVFLDRDGVLNRRIVDGYVQHWRQFVILRGVRPALCALRALNFQLVIVSNQAAVAKGLLSCEELANITRMSLDRFHAAGGSIDGAFFCLHQPADECPCRKPKPGLLREAARRLPIDFDRSFLIGDSPADILAGTAMGCNTVYLTRALEPSVQASHQSRTIGQAVQWIVTRSTP